MISITFIVGAGASNEVNMPTGAELKRIISKLLDFSVTDFRNLTGGDPKIRETLYQLAQRRPQANGNIDDYVRTARLIGSAMPQAVSIDNFIDSHRSNPRVAECGKLAIAAAILKAERNSFLYVDPSNTYNRLNFTKIEDTWFNALFQLITVNTQKEDLPGRLRKIKIISFNYDRCIEHFLFHSLRNYYELSEDEATLLLGELQILHPYGTVGPLPWQSSSWRVPYGADASSSELLRISEGIRTFTEGTDASSSQIEVIRSSVWDAERLVFLGFAFHELNLEVIFGDPSTDRIRYDKQVFGSAYGLSESNKKTIANEIKVMGRYDADQIILRRELKAAQVFPEYSRSLRI